MNCYLDIETTGLDPLHHKIITIQYMELERNTAKPVGPLKILKEWESDEKTILTKFISESGMTDKYTFTFVPVGFNLEFEHKFFWQRCMSNALQPVDILNRPFLDLKTVGVIMNKGEFKGSGLDKITNKPQSGKDIPRLYDEKNYGEIEKYIKIETESFCEWLAKLYVKLPKLRDELLREN
jgi:hypothetical protein